MKNKINSKVAIILLPIFLATLIHPSYGAELIMGSNGQAQSVVSLNDQIESESRADLENAPALDPFEAGALSAPTSNELPESSMALQVGEFQAGGCTQPTYSTSASSTACVGVVQTAVGLREIHSYNQRGNTGLIIYDENQNKIASVSIPAWNGQLAQEDIIAMGNLAVVSHGVNQITVVNLSTGDASSGWTRASGTSDLAYRGDNVKGIEVLNLQSGAVSQKPSSQNAYWPLKGQRQGVMYVLTSEGLKEIYEEVMSSAFIKVFEPATNSWREPALGMGSSGFKAVAPSPDGEYLLLASGGPYLLAAKLTGVFEKFNLQLPALYDHPTLYVNTITFSSDRSAVITTQIEHVSFNLELQPNGAPVITKIIPEGWAPMPGNSLLVFKVDDAGKPVVLDLQTYVIRDMKVGDISSMDEDVMLNYFSNVTGFPTYGISLTASVINHGGRLKPVVEVAYILRFYNDYKLQTKGTIFFDINGVLENAHEMETDRSLKVGEFLVRQCTQPLAATSSTSTACVGVMVTEQGLREIHSYNQNGNTGIKVYREDGTHVSFSFPAHGLITEANFTDDGKYLAAPHTVNRVSVISLHDLKQTGTVSMPEWSGPEPHGAPTIDRVESLGNEKFFIHTNDSQVPTVVPLERSFHLTIKEDQSLDLSEIAQGSVNIKETFYPNGVRKTYDGKHYNSDGQLIYHLKETYASNGVSTLSETTNISYHANGKTASVNFVRIRAGDELRKLETFFADGKRDELEQEEIFYFKGTSKVQKQVLTEMDNNQLTKLETRVYLASGVLSTASLDNRTYHANGKAATRTLDVLATTGIWTKQAWAWDEAGRALMIHTRVFAANGVLKTASLDDRTYHANGKAATRTLDVLAATGVWTKKEWTWNEASKPLTINTRVFNANGSLKSASLDSRQYYPAGKLFVKNVDTFAKNAWKNVKTAYDEYGRVMPAQKAIFADPTKTEADVTALDGINNLVVFASKPKATAATAVLSQSSSSEFGIVFDVSKNNSYAGSITSFDDFGTTAVETRNLTGMQITLGASLSAGTGTIKVEIEDKKDKKDIAYLHGVNGSEQFFSFNADIFTKVDLTAIKNINFVIVEDLVTAKVATLNVNMGDNPYAGPAFSPNPALNPDTFVSNDPAPLTGFTVGGAYDPSPSSGQSTGEAGVTVNITGGEPWGGIAVTYDDFGSTEIESADLSALPSISLVAQGDYPSLKIEIEDADGNKAFVRLGGITTSAQVWQIPLWAFKDIDFSRVRLLVYVVEGAGQDGQMTVKI